MTPAPTCAIETVTPEIAKQWLGLNHRNRRLAEPQVRRISGAIQREEWMISTDAIGLDSDGGVVNGQHRLTAVIETDTAVDMLVLRNVDPNIITVIDQGMGRSFTQLLQMDGRYTNAGVISGAVEWIYRVLNDLEIKVPTSFKPTVPQLLELLETHPKIVGSVDAGLEVGKLGINRNMAAAIHYQCASVDPDAAEEFFDRLATGLGVADGDPVYALREKINAWAKKEGRLKESAPVVGAWMIKAWEATRRGEPLLTRTLKFVHTGSRAETYPKVTEVPWLADATSVDEDTAE